MTPSWRRSINKLETAGITTAIGMDEAGINDDRDMLQEMRMVLRAHRVPGMDDEVPTPAQVFRMATSVFRKTISPETYVRRNKPAQGLNDIVRNPNNTMNPSDAQRREDQARREDQLRREDRAHRREGWSEQERTGAAIAGHPNPAMHRTPRWREMDSNVRSPGTESIVVAD
jgi:hypothetical protein